MVRLYAFKNIWSSGSKPSNYRGKLRYHACDERTDGRRTKDGGKWKIVQCSELNQKPRYGFPVIFQSNSNLDGGNYFEGDLCGDDVVSVFDYEAIDYQLISCDLRITLGAPIDPNQSAVRANRGVRKTYFNKNPQARKLCGHCMREIVQFKLHNFRYLKTK